MLKFLQKDGKHSDLRAVELRNWQTVDFTEFPYKRPAELRFFKTAQRLSKVLIFAGLRRFSPFTAQFLVKFRLLFCQTETYFCKTFCSDDVKEIVIFSTLLIDN